jgi:predicted dehydrogenase
MTRTRYAIVGTGSRATRYIDALCGMYSGVCDLVALCDTSPVRISYHNRRLVVTFNYRYSAAYTRLRQLVAEGAIGTPHLVDFSWMLDTSHGADYFRRWHREKPMSGGLLVHKASHHFDLVNWWICSWPEISIEDTMAICARYRSGTLLSYSLVAYSPWEGLRVAITGDKGRVELDERHGAHVIEETPTGEGSEGAGVERRIRLFPMFRSPVEIEVEAEPGPHAGDGLMLEQLFAAGPPPDPWDRAASHLDGAAAVLLGAAANKSLAEGVPVVIDRLGDRPLVR